MSEFVDTLQPLDRSISAPETDDRGHYKDIDTLSKHPKQNGAQNTTDSDDSDDESRYQRSSPATSVGASPMLDPLKVSKLLNSFNFNLDTFLSQNFDQDVAEMPMQVYNNLRADLSKTKTQLKNTTSKLQNKVDRTTDNFKAQVDTSLMILRQNMKKASVVRLKDKVAFTLGMSDSCLTPWMMSAFPAYVPVVHSVQTAILVGVRYYLYKKKQWHYFLIDMCYFVNVLVALYLFVFPHSQFLFAAVWLLTHGPLGFAIVAWRNSLVLHSLDKVTSLYIHIAPCLTLYTIRWLYPDSDQTRFGALKGLDTLPAASSLGGAMGLYTLWQIGYYYFVVVRQKKRADSQKRVTSWSWLLSDPNGGLISKASHVFGAKWSIPMFMALQFTYTFITCFMALAYYQSFALNTLFLVSLALISFWNGSCYMFEIFSKQYEKNLLKLAASASDPLSAATKPLSLSTDTTSFKVSTSTAGSDASGSTRMPVAVTLEGTIADESVQKTMQDKKND